MGKKYGVFIASWTFEGWLKDSITESLETMREYVAKNRDKLKKVDPDFDVLHYPEGNQKARICDLALTEEEQRIVFGKR